MSEPETSQINKFRSLISEAHIAFGRRNIITSAASLAAFFLSFWAVFSLLEHTFYLEPAVKIIFWIGLGGGLSAIWFKLSQKISRTDFSGFYSSFTKEMNLDKLRYALDLLENPRNDSSVFTQKAIVQNISHLTEEDVSKQISKFQKEHPSGKLFRNALTVFAASLVLFLVAWASTDNTSGRMLAFWQTFDKPNPYIFTVSPGSTTIEQGERFRIEVEFNGSSLPSQVSVAQKTDVESNYRTRPLNQTDDNIWISESSEHFSDMSYYLLMDGYKSPVYNLEVQLIPRFRELIVEVQPPAYTRLEKSTYTYPFNRIEAYRGSEITISGKPNKDILQPKIYRHRFGDTLIMEASASVWKTAFRIQASDSISFAISDQHGLTNRNPFNFRLISLPDQYPYVRIIQPERELTGMNINELQLTYDVEDDFGITRVRLYYELLKAFTNNPITGYVTLPLPSSRNNIERYAWDISDLGLSSMDVLTYWIEVRDNDQISGFKTSISEHHKLTIQSLADYLFEQEEKEEQISSSMSEVQERMDRMQDEYERLRNQVRDTPDERWEQSQTIEEIERQRQELEEHIEEIRKQFEELREEMMNDSSLSEETLERYKELQALMEEIDDPEILEMLKKMQEDLSQMNQRQLREALDQMEFNEERYRERLERTVELFKQLKLDSDLNRATQVLDELLQREEQLSQMEEYSEQEIEQQQQIKKELDRLGEKLDKLPENAPRRQQENIENLNQEMQQQLDEMQQQLDENIEEMQEGGDQQNIQQQQQQIMQQMQQMANRINESREMMNQEQTQVNILALQNILQSIILLSEEQEEILHQTSGLRDQSSAFVELARRERFALQSFQNVADSLYEVSKEIPQFTNRINTRRGEILKTMEQAVGYMIERERNNSTNAQRISMSGLNQIGTMLADLIDQLMNMDGGGGGGMSMQQMMQQMQEMGGQQQQLNQQIQDFINDMQGERLTRDNMERLDQMARQQNQIREQIRNLQQSGGLEPGDQALSELERMAEEMEDAINDMRGGSVDQLMVQRQQNILSRMLETERSLQERDIDEERREGDAPGEFDISRVPELTLEELQQKIRTGLQDPNQTRFNEDYQRLIERYFELLRDQNNRNP